MTLTDYLHSLEIRCVRLMLQAMEHDDVEGMIRLIVWTDARICVNPGWHHKEWTYLGQQRYSCGICERMSIVA